MVQDHVSDRIKNNFLFYIVYIEVVKTNQTIYMVYIEVVKAYQTMDSSNLHKNTKSNFTQNFSKWIKNYRACLLIIFKNNFRK